MNIVSVGAGEMRPLVFRSLIDKGWNINLNIEKR